MKTVVTGAAGFIGGALVSRLLELGHEVTAVDNFSGDSTEDYQKATKIVRCDVQNAPMMRDVAEEADVVFHLACKTQALSFSQPKQDVLTNVIGSLAVAQGAAAHKAKVVFASSVSVYNGGIGFSEAHAPQPQTVYGISKLAAEQMIHLVAPNSVVLRFSNVFGPGQNPKNPHCGVVGRWIAAAKAGEPIVVIGDGTQVRDFTYIVDAVDALILAAELPGGLVCNISTGKGTTLRSVAASVHELFPTAPVVYGAPPRDIDVVSRRIVPNQWAAQTLGWRPRFTVEEGIRLAAGA